MKKGLFLLSLILVITMTLSACGGAGAGDTIKVGGIGELTGDIPAVGASFKNAAEMAVDDINDAGGLDVGGKKYQSSWSSRIMPVKQINLLLRLRN